MQSNKGWEVGPLPRSSETMEEPGGIKLLIESLITVSLMKNSCEEWGALARSWVFMRAILEAQRERCSGAIITSGLEKATDWKLFSNEMVLVEIIGSQTLSKLRRSRAPSLLSTLSAGMITLYAGQSWSWMHASSLVTDFSAEPVGKTRPFKP